MKEFRIKDHIYLVDERTAIAVSAGCDPSCEDDRQFGVFVRDYHDGMHDDAFVFAASVPETEEDMEELLLDEGFTTDCEDLGTVLPECNWIDVLG